MMTTSVPTSRTALRVLASALLAVGLGLSGAAHAATDFEGLAHQGAHDGLPGDFDYQLDPNTLRAFTAASRHGLINETDLRISSDGVFFMVHNAGLAINSVDCTGDVADRPASYIRGCHTEHGYLLPTFRQTVQRTVRDGGRITVEVKPDSRITTDPDRWVGRMEHVIRKNGAESNVWLEATGAEYLRAFRDVAPELKVVWKAGSSDVTGESAERLSVDTILLKHDTPVSKVEEMHEHGLVVYSRRTKDAQTWSRLDADGWDGTLTDFSARFVEWRSTQ